MATNIHQPRPLKGDCESLNSPDGGTSLLGEWGCPTSGSTAEGRETSTSDENRYGANVDALHSSHVNGFLS